MMSPQEFIARWQNNDLSERAGAQTHFTELCDLLGVEKPIDPDNYCFERGAQKSGGGGGWADVWKRGFFGWENKKPGRDLKAALKQLTDYALALENPPLLVVCDREVIEIHTAFSGYPDEPRTIRITDLIDEDKRQLLRWVFTDPIKLRPEKSTAAITLEMAGEFADLADKMRGRGLPRQQVAHFLMQCLFCMFAEDEAVLPDKIFSGLLHKCQIEPEKASERLTSLFKAMNKRGGVAFGLSDIPWFNGGLFSTIDVPQLTVDDIVALIAAAYRDWRAIDPSIFGTLFERGLLSNDRAKLGAHYTDTATIEKLIAPVVREPLMREWEETKKQMEAAKKLNELRENWLNPPQWVDWVRTPEEEVAGFPLRPVAKSGHEADLKKRTLTNLYNERPSWLKMAHEALDKAVALAYGWNDYTPEMSDAEILKRLLTLNLQRSS